MKFKRKHWSDNELLEIYEQLSLPRQIEHRMLTLIRQGKVSKWFSAYGQEAVSVGVALGLDGNDYACTVHRNLGFFTARNISLEKLFAQFMGKSGGYTNGRDRSFHFGDHQTKIVGMISHLAAQLNVANGIALAEQLQRTKQVAVAFCGDGGTSEGDFHEALNVASVWNLPVLFVIEHNGYGLSTPNSEQFNVQDLHVRAQAYGIEGIQVDGNNILEVIQTVKKLRRNILKNGAPILLECKTFRMRGHEEASGVKYVPEGLINEWGEKDPVEQFAKYLISEGIVGPEAIQKIAEKQEEAVKSAWSAAEEQSSTLPDNGANLFAAGVDVPPKESIEVLEEVRYVDAISMALKQSLVDHENLIFMGQDIAEYGGVFKVSEGFVEQFGSDRIRNTPICESGILGVAMGLSIRGMKSVVEMQFADFVSCGFNQIVNNLAKSHWRWGQNADVVVRLPTGAGVGAGPFHSQSNESWFFSEPGLKIVYPAAVEDAAGLLLSAINDPNPVLYFEHKALYRTIKGALPLPIVPVEIGKARIAQAGNLVTVITYGQAVHWAMEVCGGDERVEVLDLRTLAPVDWDAIESSVKGTGKVMVFHEDRLTGGIGAEIAATISEKWFDYLDAPVRRCAAEDTPIPFNKDLESQFLPQSKFSASLHELIDY